MSVGEQMSAMFGRTFDGVFEKLKSGGKIKNLDVVEKYMPEIKEIAASVEKTLGDGFQWTDVIDLAKLIKPLIILADKVDGLTGDQKREFVAEAIWMAYKTYDEGPDGNGNNINVPFLFGAIEKKAEEIVIPLMAEFAVQAVFDLIIKKDKDGTSN